MDTLRVALFLALVAAPGALGCSVGFTEINGECLWLHPEVLVNWDNGVTYCQNTSTGGYLASISNANTMREIYVYIKTYGLTGSFWLGASDLQLEGDWAWLDNTRVDKGTPFWAIHNGLFGWNHEPSGGVDENCLALDESRLYYFNDAACDLLFHPICKE